MKFGFYSCMSGMPWGGSEVLWHLAARRMQTDGHEVAVNFKHWPHTAVQLKEIIEHGGAVSFREQPLGRNGSAALGLKRLMQIASARKNKSTPPRRNLAQQDPARAEEDAKWFQRERPDAVLFTLGYHSDAIFPADRCYDVGIPYAINLQCASNFFFIPSHRLEDFRRWYRNAAKVYFVSQENQDKLENNIAMRLDNAEIISNPFAMDYDADPSFPSTENGFKLAVVGRVHFQSKGQDVVVDVMKQDRWRERDLEINFYGHDQSNLQQLKDLIAMHGLEKQLHYVGFQKDVQGIWENNHGLLLPSRYEGAPLIVTETMLCQRMPITTNLGRNAELIDDNQSGFIAESATVKLVDEAMERAWQQRHRWQEMGVTAGRHIRQRYPRDPVKDFTDRLMGLSPEAI
jgi:glycosyltransferase involved in cell wall biosynthesis